MRVLTLSVTVAAFLIAAVATAQPKAPPAKDGLDEKIESIRNELQALAKKLADQYQKSTDQAEKDKLRSQVEAISNEYLDAVFALVKQQPATAAALPHLQQIALQNEGPNGSTAFQLLAKHHVTAPEIVEFCYEVIDSEATSVAAEEFLKAVAANNPDTPAIAAATLAQAVLAKTRSELPNTTDKDREKLQQAAEQALTDTATKFNKVKLPNPEGKLRTVADLAKQHLYNLQHFAIGRQPPEITGTDSAGQKFKLTDSLGKVTLVEFWADWCGPCMAMVPHERELVKKYDGQPFAIVGVNASESRQVQKQTEEKNQMTWRSFHDGEDGPISHEWQITAYPTIYVLDHKGVIRYKNVRGKDLDEAIAKLVAAAGK